MSSFDLFDPLFLSSRWNVLKSVELKSDSNPTWVPASVVISTNFFSAPLLTYVSLLSEAGVRLTEIPLGQLTSLSLVVTLSVADHLTILSQCPNLITCTLHICYGDNIGSGAVIELPHLKSLTIAEAEFSIGLDTLFACLSTPSLQHFALESQYRYDRVPFPVPSFLSFLARTKCKCQAFAVHAGSISSDELIRCLIAMPSLRYLSISSRRSDAFCSDVVATMTRDNLLPLLEDLVLNADYSMGVVVQFVNSRRPPLPGLSRLNSLKLSGCPARFLEDRCETGLKVEYI